jgi:hypothetical protein
MVKKSYVHIKKLILWSNCTDRSCLGVKDMHIHIIGHVFPVGLIKIKMFIIIIIIIIWFYLALFWQYMNITFLLASNTFFFPLWCLFFYVVNRNADQKVTPPFFFGKYLFPSYENYTVWRVMVWLHTLYFYKVFVHFYSLMPMRNKCVCFVGTVPCPAYVDKFWLCESYCHQSQTSYC